MKKLFIMAAAVAVYLSSCSTNEVHLNQSAENAVSFSTYTGISTKGAEMTNDALEAGFGVLAYDHGSLGTFDSESTPNFMYNTEVSDASGSWSYSPLKYWSSDDYNYYSFFAYAPYSGDVVSNAGTDTDGSTIANTNGGIVLSAAGAVGAPTATLTLATDVEAMVDFVAGQDVNRANDRETVALNMKHQLTRVTFSAKASIDSDDTASPHYVNVTSIRLLGSAPVSPIDIETVVEVASPSDDTQYDKQIGDKYYKVETIEAGTEYNTAYFGSDALYASSTYTFNTTTTTNTTETEHGQDGTWAVGDVLSTDLDASPLLNTTLGFADDDNISYAEKGVLVQSTAVDLFTEDEYLFLIPPVYTTITDGVTTYQTGIIADENSETTNLNGDNVLNNIQVEVIYDIVTVDASLAAGYIASSTNNIAIVEIPSETLVQGYAYDFLLTINGKSYTNPTDTDVDEDEDDPDTEDALVPVEISGNVITWDVASDYDDITLQ